MRSSRTHTPPTRSEERTEQGRPKKWISWCRTRTAGRQPRRADAEEATSPADTEADPQRAGELASAEATRPRPGDADDHLIVRACFPAPDDDPGGADMSQARVAGTGAGRHRRLDGFTLLFVCTGNVCRSPFAEVITRHALLGRLGDHATTPFDVSSAGVHAVAGSPMHPLMRAELRPAGLDRDACVGRFRSRPLHPDLVGRSDLVLALDLTHRAAVVDQVPTALPIVFGLREFARLAAAVDPAALPAGPVPRAAALVGLARAARGAVPPARPGADEVPDPMGGPAQSHHRAAQLILAAVHTIVDLISPDGWPALTVGARRDFHVE